MIINLYFPALHCVTKDLSSSSYPRPGIIIWLLSEPQWHDHTLILRSWLYSKIEHKTAESDTTEGEAGGEYFFFHPQHFTQKGNKLKGSGKLLEWKLFNFLQLAHSATSLPGLWSLQSSCSNFCTLRHDCSLMWRSSWHSWHVAWRGCLRPSVSLASLPSSLISVSVWGSVSVINLPPDINLFQLLRVSPGQNKHPGDHSVSGSQASCVSPLRGLDSRLKGLLFMTCVTSTFRRDLNVVQRLFSLRYFCFSLAASQEVEVKTWRLYLVKFYC